ncbi:hypothetical protein K1719_042719 [Acacia pycnantha]|nr:hypothetical protein K1719_042719 [Acacia pycnantha]
MLSFTRQDHEGDRLISSVRFCVPHRFLQHKRMNMIGVSIAAARAVYALGSSTTKAKKEMGEFGYIDPLIQMLDDKVVEEKEAAAMALSIPTLYIYRQ